MSNLGFVSDNLSINLSCSALLEQLPCAMGIKNSESIYVAANQQVARIAGFLSAKELIGIQDKDLNCPAAELSAIFMKQDKEALTTNKVINLDISKYSDNKLHVFLSTKTKLIDNNNQSFVLFTMTELPIGSIAKVITTLSQSSLRDPKSFASSYQLRNIKLIPEDTHPILTNRLSEVLFLLLHGKSIKAIAHTLNISFKTAEEHINRLKKIFSCYTKSQLIEKAFALGYAQIIPPSLL